MLISVCQAFYYLNKGAIMIQIWGKQKPPKQKRSVNTRLANLTNSRTKGEASVANTNVKVSDDQLGFDLSPCLFGF